jgi:hypothetical protein
MSRAQIKMFETISVLVVFFFILIFGLVWYNNSQRAEIVKILDENNQLRAMETVSIATNLPELQCSLENIQTTNCFELVKLDSFRSVTTTNKLYYTNLFSSANLTVRQIYPQPAPGSGVWELYSSKPKKTTSTQKQFVPVLIYDSVARKYYAAMLTVEVYS